MSVYETLQAEIVSLRLKPGQMLDETSIATRFDMSRSPVREALIRLSNDGLVITLPNRSTIVAPIEMSIFPKYVEALDIAQRVNTRLAAKLRSDKDLETIADRQSLFQKALDSGNHFQMSEANKEFHMAIARAGQNPYLAALYERLLDQGRRMLHLHFEHLDKAHNSYHISDEHSQILMAIKAKDVEHADSLAHAHTLQFRENFNSFIRTLHTDGIDLKIST